MVLSFLPNISKVRPDKSVVQYVPTENNTIRFLRKTKSTFKILSCILLSPKNTSGSISE